MKIVILTAGILAVSVPGLAAAQTACQRAQQSNEVAGTVVGAGVGALLGSAVAGHGSGTEGAILGGIGGAVAGNVIAKQAGQPCPSGYYEVPSSAPAYATPTAWSDLPSGYHDRLDRLEDHVRGAERAGSMTHAQAADALQRIAGLRRQEMDLRRRDGGTLSDADRDFLQARLDESEHQVGWTEQANADGSVPRPVYTAPYDRGPDYEVSTAAPVGFDGYPEFRGQEAHIRGGIAALGYRPGASDLAARLNGIRAEESREYGLYGWRLPLDAHDRIRSQLDRLDRDVDLARGEP